jgi:lantibiotic modifying enzyme
VLTNAVAIADYLIEQANFDHPEQLWSFIGSRGELFYPASFYGGASGIAHYFCEVAQVTADTRYYQEAARILDWLDKHTELTVEIPHGLYFGYAGYILLCAQIGEKLQEPRYQKKALLLASQLAKLPFQRLDLTHGAAGRGLLHLSLYWLSGDHEQLEYAQAIADEILRCAKPLGEGLIWEEEERIFWGFAHGIAGIAYFLLALYSETEDPDLREKINRVNRSILDAAVSLNEGISWPKDSKDTGAPWCHWCHGASGVGTYLLEAATRLDDSTLRVAAIQATRAIQENSGLTTVCQCHGLAGDGDFLVQASRMLDLPELEAAIQNTLTKIMCFRRTLPEVPAFVWSNEALDPDPDYMTGYCGVYGFLLRTFYPDLPRPLSLRHLRKG